MNDIPDYDVAYWYAQHQKAKDARKKGLVMLTIPQAIARMEGFYQPGTRAARNNNPGNMVYGQFAINHGATGGDGRYAIFPTPDAGFAAMRALLQEDYKGLTVAEAISKWAPSTENDTSRYIKLVCQWTGLKTYTVIDNYLG